MKDFETVVLRSQRNEADRRIGALCHLVSELFNDADRLGLALSRPELVDRDEVLAQSMELRKRALEYTAVCLAGLPPGQRGCGEYGELLARLSQVRPDLADSPESYAIMQDE